MGEILEKIAEWREAAWDGTLHGYMEWGVRGAELHKELYEHIGVQSSASSPKREEQ